VRYRSQDLILIVKELADKYCAGESSSVSYEKARQLMGAVLYCIHEAEISCPDLPAAGPAADARQIYEAGRIALIDKVKRTQGSYNAMIGGFCAYGNRNYHDTVTKGLPAFFLNYDPDFAPQETVIMMDYPTLMPAGESSGIDAAAEYIEQISLEQSFLSAYPQEYVEEILRKQQYDYEEQFFNICQVFLNHLLCRLLTAEDPGGRDPYRALRGVTDKTSEDGLRELLMSCLGKLPGMRRDNDDRLSGYLASAVPELAMRLKIGSQNDCLENIVVLLPVR